MRFGYGVIVLSLLAPSAGAGQAGRRDVEEGNRRFAEGQFDLAREKYLDAVRAAPESPVARFNAANALYRTEDFQNALEEYQQALELGDSALQAAAWYNLGNALYRQQSLPESLEAFKQALRIDPTDADAKHNLERVLEKMQQQEQQQDQDQDQQDQQQQNPEDQPQDQQPQNGGQDNQDQQQDDQEGKGNPGQQDQQPPDEAPGNPQEQEGPPPRMTPEEVERLLQAVNEDPSEMRRQAARMARPVKVKKDW